MAIHQNLKPSDQEIPLLLAGQALSRVDGLVSRPMGAVSVDNVDGSSTLIGGNTDTGIGDNAGDVSGGVITQVGKTSLPGTPSGLSVSSVGLTVLLNWDGSFENSRGGAVRVEAVLTDADGKTISMGSLTGAGVLTALATVPGMASVAVTAYDDAHDETGAAAPNHSDTVTLDIVLSELVDSQQITDAVDANRKTLDQANKDLEQAKTDIEAAASTAQSAKTTADKAVSDAVKAVSDAASATSTASSAQRNAATALTSANTALQRAKNITVSFTAPANPATGDIWYPKDYYGRVIGMKTWGGYWWEDVTIMAGSIIVPGSIGSTLIGNGQITTGKLTTGSVTTDKIAANSVTANKLVANSVTTDKLAANTVNADKLAANSVTADKIAANAVNADKLAANSVTANKLAANSVTADKIAANSITADKIKGNRLVGAQIQTSENAPYMLMTSHNTVNQYGSSHNSGVIQFIGKNNAVMGGLGFGHSDDSNTNMGDENYYYAYLAVTDPKRKKLLGYANYIQVSDTNDYNKDYRSIDIYSKSVTVCADGGDTDSCSSYVFGKDGLNVYWNGGGDNRGHIPSHTCIYSRTDSEVQGRNIQVNIMKPYNLDDFDFLDIEYVTGSLMTHGSQRFYKPSNGTWVGFKMALSLNYYGVNNIMWVYSDMLTVMSQTFINCTQAHGQWLRGYSTTNGQKNANAEDAMWITRIEGWRN